MVVLGIMMLLVMVLVVRGAEALSITHSTTTASSILSFSASSSSSSSRYDHANSLTKSRRRHYGRHPPHYGIQTRGGHTAPTFHRHRQQQLIILFAGGGGEEAGAVESSLPSADTDTKEGQTTNTKSNGRNILCLVALLYGTLNVSLRMVYQSPDPPTAAALSATRGWLAALCFLPLMLFQHKKQQQQNKNTSASSSDKAHTAAATPPLVWLAAGLELAVWNGLAQGLLNAGLLSTGSARASFLTQTSVVLTPLISIVAGQSVSKQTWIGCAVALVGLTLLSGGAAMGAGAGGLALAFSTGDWLVLGGALTWSCYLFRLSSIGSRFDEIPLQFLKTLFLAVLYTIWFLTSAVVGGGVASAGVAATVGGLGILAPLFAFSLPAWGALLYSAVFPGTMADVLQQQGQRDVSPSEANVLLSMEPVFAAICARLLLGEVTTTTETVGGGLILAAALIASSGSGSSGTTTADSIDTLEEA